MKQEVKIGQTDYSVLVLIRDTAGAPKTALAYNSDGLDVCYVRVETDNDVVLTDGAPATLSALTDAHTDWGFLKVDDTKCPGLYRLDIADGVFASGAWSAVVSIIGTGLDPTHLEFVLVPEAPIDGGKVVSIAANAITATAINADAITEAKIADNAIASEHLAATGVAKVATGVWQDATAGDFTTASSIGKALYIANVAPGGSGGHLISGSNAGTTTLGALVVTGTTTHTGAVLHSDATTFTGAVTATNASNDIKGVFVATNGLTATAIATGAITNAKFAAGAIDAAAVATGAIDADALAADAGTEIGTAVWATAARTLTAATNITSTGGTTVPQTGDSYARLGAPAGASIAADLVVIDNFVDDLEGRVIGTLAAGTHNPQSGDAYARLGAPAGASVSADIAAIEAQTDDIGAAGAGLTAIPTIAAVTTVATTTNLTNLPAVTTDWLTAAGVKADAVTKIQNGLATPTNITAGTITTATNVTTVNGIGANVITATAIQDGAITNAKVADDVDVNVKTVTNGAITAAAIATDAIDADALAADALAEIADGILNRDMSTGTDSGSATVRTMRQALRFLRNKWSVSGTTLTVTKENDSTASWTSEITTDAAAEPVTGSDPASS